MADETTRTGEETSWWDLDVFADSELPATSFDEPLEWPETLDWGEYSAAEGDLQFPGPAGLTSDPIFPPEPAPPTPAPETASPEAQAPDAQWQAAAGDDGATMPHVTVLSGLGGGATAGPAPVAKAPEAAEAAEAAEHQRLPDSLWAGSNGGDDGVPAVVTTTIAAPTFHAEPNGGAGGWRRRLDLRHGNAAVIALISFVSLILLGMFMSVRARNQVPDTSQTRTTTDQIQVQGTLNTVPLTTTVTTTPPAINIADLVPPPEDATTVTAGGSAGAGGSSAPATTAAPRSTPTGGGGGGGGTGTTQPAAQPTNTTAAPQTTAPATTTPPDTSPPVNQPTTPTSPRRTTPTFPSLTTSVPSNDGPSIPSIPSIPGFPGFPNN